MANRTFLSTIDWLMEDWDWERNAATGIFPDKISTGSDKYAWWKCHICGFEEFKRCNNRYYGHGCSKCARKRGAIQHTQTVLQKHGSVVEQYPELAREFHPSKNKNLTLYDLNKGSKRKVWWICSQGHAYQTTPYHRISGNNCPYCSGKRVQIGFNDLASTHPQVATQWHPEKNGSLLPEQVTAGSNKKVWWLCPQEHSYQATVANRVIGTSCPVCIGKQVLPGVNDLQSQSPIIAQEWHSDKNGSLTPAQVTIGSNKRVWWQCRTCGYIWKQHIYTRQICGCPACSNKRLYPKHNDLATLHPKIASQWHPTRNGAITPCNIVAGGNKPYWWKCEICGFEWNASIASRIRGRSCPECAKIQRGISHSTNKAKRNGSLQETHPDLAAQWNYTMNTTISPNEITFGSSKKVWWICERGHEWMATISSRVRGNSCQKCNDEYHTSFPEQVLCFYFSQCTPAINRAHVQGREIDVYLPDLNIGIEYDGKYYHSNRAAQDLAKVHYFAQHGIRIIRIVESNIFDASNDVIQYPATKDYSSLTDALIYVMDLLNLEVPDINISRDSGIIYGHYIYQQKSRSLAVVCPNVAAEWDYEKNHPVTPELISYGSKKIFWWKCKNGHSWQAPVCARTNKHGGRGCGFCSGHRKYIHRNFSF